MVSGALTIVLDAMSHSTPILVDIAVTILVIKAQLSYPHLKAPPLLPLS